MKDRDTPLRLVRKWEKMIPGIYSTLDTLRRSKDEGEILWPDYCELPIGAAFTWLVHIYGINQQDAAGVAAELTACWTWRKTKIMYAFDGDLAKTLAAQADAVEDTDILPCDLLLHLPYPCIYIKAPDILEETDGFFAWIEYDLNRSMPELRIQWVTLDFEYSFAQVLHLLPGQPIKDCILDTIHTTQENLGEDIKLQDVDVSVARIILSAVQLLLYLVSENSDVMREPPKPTLRVSGRKPAGQNPPKPKPSEDKASQIVAYDVGVRVGAALRRTYRSQPHKSAGAQQGGTKRSHARRGHWHHYWTGPLQGERNLILKWTAPTVIHPEAGMGDNVVMYPIKPDKEVTEDADLPD